MFIGWRCARPIVSVAGCARLTVAVYLISALDVLKACATLPASCCQVCQKDHDCGKGQVAAATFGSGCAVCQARRCAGAAQFQNCSTASVIPNRSRPGVFVFAQILPHAWNLSSTLLNYTDGKLSQGFMWYDSRWGAMRQDFEAPCPFHELQPPLTNDGPCSMIFLKGMNYYIHLHLR